MMLSAKISVECFQHLVESISQIIKPVSYIVYCSLYILKNNNNNNKLVPFTSKVYLIK